MHGIGTDMDTNMEYGIWNRIAWSRLAAAGIIKHIIWPVLASLFFNYSSLTFLLSCLAVSMVVQAMEDHSVCTVLVRWYFGELSIGGYCCRTAVWIAESNMLGHIELPIFQ